ncbi:beta-1,3-glucanase family protein [Allokutzneria albata]|uniref:Beta-1,3-glucanase n=1 Tax=Allokutzneria albata TaxID=211114 RepID=A0A1G9UH73_ALLAB|nr:beta-1,3-glucanase family protein [Allokutzneria albata]SDM59290.1 Beta-1,3-glucanase [Allokutzneria albata]
MRTRLLSWLAATAVLLGVTAVPAQAAPSLLPLTVTNNSGRADQVHLYVLGVYNGRLGHVNAAGAFTPWSGGGNPPVPAPDVSIAGPGQGGSRTLNIPINLAGGRLYMSFGEKLKFFLTPDGLVQPAPWNPSDPNRNILFDWSEFTYNNGGLWLNSSQVDMFSVPHAVEVTASTGQVKKTGELVGNGRNRIFDGLRNQGGDWGRLVHTRPDGTRVRALAPRLGIESGIFGGTYFDSYTQSAWNTYRTTDLTVVPYENEPGKKFIGRTDGGGVMHFTNTAGARVASFQQPSSRDIFGCDGRLAAPNNDIGAIARTLCAALHRSTLGFLHTQPTVNPAEFYTRAITDHYSKIIHANMVDGKAYGFAFDDVGHFESLVHDGNPRSARVVLTPF